MPTVLITGANRGIGLEFTRQYAADGWRVIACCRTPAKAGELKKLAAGHDGVTIQPLDVAAQDSIATLARTLQDVPVDLLINNAGIYSGARGAVGTDRSQEFGSIDPAAWSTVFSVNSIAPIMVIEALLQQLKKGSGRKVVNITSRMGAIGEMGSGSIAYRSSKAALNAAMRVVAHNLHREKITIANLHPGWVQTDMGGTGGQLTPEQSVTAMRKVIDGMTHDPAGQFLSYDGTSIAW